MKNKKGFTLIELLAVIVILAVLMVIAVPKILNVIDSSRSSAASSSIKLIKDGIKTNVTSAEMMPTNPYTKTEGCYIFDFDNNNTNVQNLNIDNKERTGGSIKLCNGKFSDDTLTFDGSSGSSSSGGSSTPAPAPELVTSSLKIHYDGKDPGNDSTKWQDLSGNNNHGTISSATYDTDGYLFNGSSAINTNGVFQYSNLTAEVLFSTDTIESGNHCLYSNTEGQGYALQVVSGKIGIIMKNPSGGYAGVSMSTSISTGEKYHVVTTYDGTNIKLYVNGSYIGSTPLSSIYYEYSYRLLVGANPRTNGSNPSIEETFNGKIYDFKLYDRALTEDEVSENYQYTMNRYN